MSGRSYDYAYSKLNDFIADLRLTTPMRKAFKAHLELVSDAMQAVEWVDSCDCSEPHGDDAIRKVLGENADALAANEILKDAKKYNAMLAEQIADLKKVLGRCSK